MEINFFNSEVHKYLLSLEKPTYSKVLKHIKLLETYGNKLTMPYSKPISNNLFELRTRGQQEIRILYCYFNNQTSYFIPSLKNLKKLLVKKSKLRKKE